MHSPSRWPDILWSHSALQGRQIGGDMETQQQASTQMLPPPGPTPDGVVHRATTNASASTRSIVLRVAIGIVVVAAIGAGAFAAGRATAPDGPLESPPTAAADLSADELFELALQLHANGELDAAGVLYADVLALDPSNKYAHFNLGVIDQFAGDNESAIERYEAALVVDPAYGPALYNVGLAYSASGDRLTAIDRLRKAVEVSPDSAPAMFKLGVLLVDAGEEVEGNELLQRAYEIDPTLEITP
jgi:Tfp pilus assembly protein PilF